MPKKHVKNEVEEPHMICDEGEGAALANPLFEQMCCKSRNNDGEEPGTATCSKCGLTEREAIDLSDARNLEAQQGKRTTGYFSNAMSMPSAGVSNQQRMSMPPAAGKHGTSPNRPQSPSPTNHGAHDDRT